MKDIKPKLYVKCPTIQDHLRRVLTFLRRNIYPVDDKHRTKSIYITEKFVCTVD